MFVSIRVFEYSTLLDKETGVDTEDWRETGSFQQADVCCSS